MNKIRLGVIGTGMAWERLHYPVIKELGDKYEIVALTNRTKEDAEKFANKINLDPANVYNDYNEMLKREDIDAVDIIVPIEDNFKVSEDVARAGKSFICEKPLAPDMEQAEKFLELTQMYQVKILIAENNRYNEENNKIKELVSSGRIGEVVYFIRNNVSCFPCEMTKDTYAAKEWRQHPVYKGGAFLDAGVHDIAALIHIFGGIECVQAFGRPQKEDYNPYMSINSNILFKNGVIGHYTYFPSGVEYQKPLIGLRIFGTQGEIYLEERSCGIINVFDGMGNHEEVSYTPKRGFYNELLNFYNSLVEKEKIYVVPEVEYNDVKAVFDILRSVRTRQIIYFDKHYEEVENVFVNRVDIYNEYLQ